MLSNKTKFYDNNGKLKEHCKALKSTKPLNVKKITDTPTTKQKRIVPSRMSMTNSGNVVKVELDRNGKQNLILCSIFCHKT
jgi:hypothetical protein